MPIAAVDVEGLLEVVWVSVLAGSGITVAFSLVVLGGARSAASRREGRGGAAVAFGAIAAIAFAIFVAAVVFGVNVMLSKD
jgi:hypothetical protein